MQLIYFLNSENYVRNKCLKWDFFNLNNAGKERRYFRLEVQDRFLLILAWLSSHLRPSQRSCLWIPTCNNTNTTRVGGVVVSVLATGPKGCWFKPSQCYGFLMVIKIRSTPSFGWEVKPETPCHKILRPVKNLTYHDLDVTSAKLKDISRHLLEWLLDVSVAAREHWWLNQGCYNSDGGAQYVRQWLQCLGRCVRHHPATVRSNTNTENLYAETYSYL
jgi:hypothetical protein